MRHFVRIILLFAVVSAFAPTHFAQAVAQSPQNVTMTRPGKLASYYNESQDKTTVVLGFSDVGGESACGLYVSASASYPGKTVVSPAEVKLTIMRITPEEQIKSAPLRDLTVTADSVVMNLGLMETASQQTMMDLRWETLQISVPYSSFVKVANAKSVDAKLGSAKFVLTENNLNFLRQFAGRLKP